MYEPFARLPKDEPQPKERPPKAGTPEFVDYLRKLNGFAPHGEALNAKSAPPQWEGREGEATC